MFATNWGALSLLVGNSAFDKLLERFGKGLVRVKGFMDDPALLVEVPHFPTLIDQGQEATEEPSNLGKENDLTFGGLGHCSAC